MSDTMRSPLLDRGWQYLEKTALDDFRAPDWEVLERQRGRYYAAEQARHALRFLTAAEHDASFGYQVNNYRHCLQSATLVMQAGHDEETVVTALLHDVGFTACPETHGAFAAALLGPYVSEANRWMLEHHAAFQLHHCHGHPGLDRAARERWRGHPHFEWTAEFVEKYDQNAIDPRFREAPIETFVPMVQRIFSRGPRAGGHGP